jgi:hypothetical protein
VLDATRHPDVGARVLVYDIETSPNLGHVWAKWRTNVIAFDRQWFILSFAYKWLGEKRTHVLALPDFDLYDTDPHNDRELVARLHELFCEADVTVTHNGKGFDNKKANTRMLVHGMDPPPPRKEIDTLQIARRQFGFTSNRLGDLCQLLGLPNKADSGGFETWMGCLNGDPKAWAKMKKYNKQDIPTLEALYLRFRPWMANHPNLNVYGDRPHSCPRCGHNRLQARGYRVAGVTMRRRFQCKKCRGYCMGRNIHDTRIAYRSI